MRPAKSCRRGVGEAGRLEHARNQAVRPAISVVRDTMWSPGDKSRKTASDAARPLAKARPWRALPRRPTLLQRRARRIAGGASTR